MHVGDLSPERSVSVVCLVPSIIASKMRWYRIIERDQTDGRSEKCSKDRAALVLERRQLRRPDLRAAKWVFHIRVSME